MAHKLLNIIKAMDMTVNDYTAIFDVSHSFELSITGTWTGTIALLRRADTTSPWGVAQTYTENIEDSAVFQGKTTSQYMLAVWDAAGTGVANIRAYKGL